MTRPWNQMWDLFHSALELAPPSREAWLRERCPDDSVRAKVADLLAAHDKADGFLESNSGWGLPASGQRGTALQLPTFDRYQVGDKIGEGGFSEVFHARQLEPVQRDVAIKVLRANVTDARRRSERVLERFEAERQTLASLHHPGIATIFDAGISPDGRPYFVMEHIAGVPISRYCAERKLPLRRKLDLFMETCAAVQHAHHKGVIHRDLKPSNILITEIDGVPRVKVIDFGIASVVQEPDEPSSSASRWRGGTPGYMSPEQAGAGDTDTRSDVFSLGVVLYELLAGAPPLPSQGRGLSEEIERTQARAASDPPPPSARAQGPHARSLQGELDWIVMKALARDRAARYASASELADDLKRHLEGWPVLAGPDTRLYRAAKFVSRHRFGVAAAVAGAAIITGGGIFFAIKAQTEARLRADAQEAEQKAVKAQELAVRDARMSEQIGLFLRTDIISAAAARPESSAVMLEILDAAEKRVAGRYKDDPVSEAAVRRTLGDVYASLKRNDHAIANTERAVELLTKALGEDDRHTFQAINNLAIAYRQAGRSADAIPLHERGREFWRRTNGPDARETIAQTINLGGVLDDVGRFVEAEKVLQEAVTAATRAYSPDDNLPTLANFFHGNSLHSLERWTEAEEAYRRAYATQQKGGEDNPRTLNTRSRLAATLTETGLAQEAETILRSVIEAMVRRVGPEHLDTMALQGSLARSLAHQGKFEEAEPLLRKALDRHRAELGEEHRRTISVWNSMGDLYALWKKPAEAEPFFRQAADTAVATFPETNANRAKYALDHGTCLLELGRPPEAEERLREAVRLLASTLGREHPLTARATDALALALERQGKPAETGPTPAK